jgi:thiamine biosynthesis lipoprotein
MRRERAKPLLGTIVSIRACFDDGADADAAIDDAFAEVAAVHRLMSFHEADSDVSRLNREAVFAPVAVDPRTFEVLAWADSLAWASDGAFDVTAAGLLVEQGALPRPPSPFAPSPEANWRDMELTPERCTVRFRRPLWLDLGGVAKGYAVDRAAALLNARGARRQVVNAGGDLAAFGPEPEPVLLRGGDAAVIELQDGALASSGGEPDPVRAPGLHLDPRRRRRVGDGRFVAVAAETCMAADALTKVVMAEGEAAGPLLAGLGASAHLHDPGGPWRTIGAS